jgi:hypothetical protein
MNSCECGCGEPVPLSDTTSKRRGIVKGQPCRFIRGHANSNKYKPAVNKNHYEVEELTGCWIWKLSTSPEGYGQYWRDGRQRCAHIVYYEALRGPVQEGKELDHLCRTPSCVNPDHLEPVTTKVNIRRGNVAKLDDDSVRQIRKLICDGLSYKRIGEMLRVSPATVCNVKTGKHWADVV